MFALVLGVFRARTAQTVTILLLTVLAAAAATASPWYFFASARRSAVAEVVSAPTAQRLLSVRRTTSTSTDPGAALATFSSSVRGMLPVSGTGPVLGMTHSLTVSVAGTTNAVPVSYRDGVCDHLHVSGSCPAAANEALISQYAADLLAIDVGDEFELRESPTSEPLRLKVVGRYDVDDPNGVYWADPLFGRGNTGTGDQAALDPVFVPVATFGGAVLREATFAYDVPVPDALIRGDNGYDLASALKQTDYNLGAAGFFLVTPAQSLVGLIASDRADIARGVLVGNGGVVVLCWFALGLAGWYTARDRRNDVALLKLRGSTRTRILRFAFGQHLLPMALGLVVGAVVGYLAASALAGRVTQTSDIRLSLVFSAAGAAAALLGGIVVLALTELAALRTPVATLLRRANAARRGWRSDVVDGLMVAVAIAGVYQARSAATAGRAPGLALVAPALAALAVALLMARLLSFLTDRGATGALRAGRLGVGLAGIQISRRPGVNRLFALVAVTVAMLATAGGGWAAGVAARDDRSAAELGAPRVLTVATSSRTALLHAVHTADPQGAFAMAVVANLTARPPVLAVDAERLSTVARWRDEYGPVTALRPQAVTSVNAALPPLPPITGSTLTVSANNDAPDPVDLLVQLENATTGAIVAVHLGPIASGAHQASAAVTGCGQGCRLLRWEVLDQSGQSAPAGTSVSISGLTQRGPDASVLTPAVLGDARRWRASTSGPAISVFARDGALRLTVPDVGPSWRFEAQEPDNRVFTVDTALPLPVVLAGIRPPSWGLGEATLDPFGVGAGSPGTAPVPVRVVGTASALPVLGRTGILIDLNSVQRVTANVGTAGVFQVWLADGAPASAIDALRSAGLTVLADDSLDAAKRRLGEQGPAVAAWFGLLAGVVGFLLAAVALVVASTVDSAARVADLSTLRVQGLSRRVERAASYGGYAAVIVTSVLTGLLASALARYAVGPPPPLFTDGWQLFGTPATVRPMVLVVTGVSTMVILVLVWWASAARRRAGGTAR